MHLKFNIESYLGTCSSSQTPTSVNSVAPLHIQTLPQPFQNTLVPLKIQTQIIDIYKAFYRYLLQISVTDIYKAFQGHVLLTIMIIMKKGTIDQSKTSSLAHFIPLVSFYTPENRRKPKIFRCFQGVQNETSDIK